MKDYLASWKVKVVLGIIFFLFAFSLGAKARPGIDLTWELVSAVVSPKPMTFIQPQSEYEKMVDEHMKREGNKKVCRTIAELEVSDELTRKYGAKYDELSPVLNRKVTMLNGGISEDTATATVTIEKNQGR